MVNIDIEKLVLALRSAAQRADAPKRVRALMTDAFQSSASIKLAMADYQDDDEVLFEDDTVSIWYCHFYPNVHVPPHDHQTVATIGVYDGVECNHFYVPDSGTLRHKSTKRLGPGDVISIGPNAIHSVETEGANHSYAIHVYLSALTTIKRSLFDWETGESMPFTDAGFARLQRESKF